MATETQIQQLEAWLAPILSDYPNLFLVSIKIKPTNNFKIFIDGDTGFPIDLCVQINRKLYKVIEESATYPEGDFSLEISSPGVTEPLKLHRQYIKNIGRSVTVLFTDTTEKTGILLAVTEADILLEHTEGKGKKAITQQLLIPFQNIKSTTVQLQF